MNITTPRNARLSAAAAAGLVLSLGFAGFAAPAAHATTTGPAPACSAPSGTQSFQTIEGYAHNNGITLLTPVYSIGEFQWAVTGEGGSILISNPNPSCAGAVLPTTGAHYGLGAFEIEMVSGKPITDKVVKYNTGIGRYYLNVLGGPTALGYPTAPEQPVAGGAKHVFERGTVYWSSATGTYHTTGAINARYNNVGGPAGLGFPTSVEQSLSTGGVVQYFQGGRIYWSPTTGAHPTKGAIGTQYYKLGGSGSLLGYPTSGEVVQSDGSVIQHFKNGFIGYKGGVGTSVGVTR